MTPIIYYGTTSLDHNPVFMPVTKALLTDPSPELQSGLRSLLRFIVGFLFICHGASKLFGVLGGSMGSGKAALFGSLLGFSGVIEFVGGILLLIGLFTRFTAFIMAGEMAVAYFRVHAPRGFWPLMNRGELPVVYCFLLLYLAAAGGGRYAVDAILAARRRGAPVSRSGGRVEATT